jgi:hypothetical protein
MADILRDELKVTTITFDHTRKDGVVERNITLPVPAAGEKWPKQGDLPSADDVRNGLIHAIRTHPTKSHLLDPPYMLICRKYNILVTYTAPYTSPLCSIEFKWQDGKGWAANPRNQKQGRTAAEVVALVLQKWYDPVPNAEGVMQDPIHPKVWIDHCHNAMNDKIEEYAKLNEEEGGMSVLRGTIHNLENKPSPQELVLWREEAGMKRGIQPDENDLELDGDVNYMQDDDNDVDVGVEGDAIDSDDDV